MGGRLNRFEVGVGVSGWPSGDGAGIEDETAEGNVGEVGDEGDGGESEIEKLSTEGLRLDSGEKAIRGG